MPRWLCMRLGCLALVSLALVSVRAEEKPNVVLIVADDLGWADLGSYGSKFHRTPNLDALASSGQRFTQAYAACPVCSPTRAALMTGKHPARLRLTDWLPGRPDMPSQRMRRAELRQQLPLEEVTLAEVFQQAGYVTGHVGKWHLGGAGFDPLRQGFHENIAGNANGSPVSYVAPFVRGSRTIPGLEDAPEGQYLTDRLAAEAERFIEQHQRQPFFLYLPHFAVHTPLIAKKSLQDQYPPWNGIPRGRQENPIYAAMLESLDEAVGRVLARLRELRLAERTIVVFTSDNGGLATTEGPNTPATINAPLREGKGWLYEGGIRVPLIMSWPGHAAAKVDETLAWSPDVPVTLAALCGLPFPSASDGRNLAGRILNGEPVPDRDLHWHYPHYSNQGGRPGGAIRSGDWKLVEFFETGRRELFHLGQDIRENRNLFDEHPERVEELASKLNAWRRLVGAAMPVPNPDFVPNPSGGKGLIVLPARNAEVHGVMLRFEPLPHKNTLGFWVRADDWAHWDFDVREAGVFQVVAMVGCGNGSGGSTVEFRTAEQVLKLSVPETGGFQAFQPQELGDVHIPRPGRYRMEVRALSKPGAAVMDLREIRLVPRSS